MIFRLVCLFIFISFVAAAQSIPQTQYQDLEYRLIGPFRAGRTVAAVGIPTQPNVFFMGVNNGGVWKTDDYGRTWNAIFDSAPTGSVGDLAVSPSNPEIIYVGSGEGLHRPDLGVGDGIYKSVDGGKTWNHVGLRDVQQVGRLIVHPANPDIIFVAGLGHPYAANDERGVFRSTDGGKNWEKVLFKNHNTGAIQVEFDPTNPQIIYADLWEHQEGPWENASFSGSNSGLYKSTDGGTTWKPLTQGLPGANEGLGRIGVGISLSNPQRLYATVDSRINSGIYRSDDGGESWKLTTNDIRIYGRGSDFAEVRVHPKNPDIVYSANVASYRSDDGGYTWTSFKGAPGGDDYHRIWINPLQPDIMLFAADQGAIVTVNAGKTWSTWYNQPTAQLYHVATDNQFPYWVYGGQQESGAIGIASRGNGGQISFRDWMGVGADEYAYVAPDPKNPDIIYGGRVLKFNKKTGQTQNVGPEAIRSGQFRQVRTMPLIFHPADPDALLFGTNVLWKTTTGGQTWEIISPDLTRKQNEIPASVGDFKTEEMKTMRQRAVIYAVAGSKLNKDVIWAGTDDGLVHLTRDGGKTWKDVTPPSLSSWDKISQLDGGHFNTNTMYVAVNAIRKDDMKPHIFRTHDGGTTWKEITKGLNPISPINVVREDPKQPGLLFSGSEREVYFSADDGENWQSLRQNMPASSVRDLVIHDDDLVIGTHGRSIWILDNISPLREIAKMDIKKNILFQPAVATRVRHNMFSDTPLPPEEPTGKNPPDGATLDYYLSKNAKEVRIEIMTSKGEMIAAFSTQDKPEVVDSLTMAHPTYWARPEKSISTEPGHHRLVWDLRYAVPMGAQRQYAIAAVYQNTASSPVGPFVHPGEYVIKLSVDGEVQEKKISVRLDPRVVISDADLMLQTTYSNTCYQAYHQLQKIRETIDEKLANPKMKWPKGKKEQVITFRGNGLPDNPDVLYGSVSATPLENETLVSLQEKFLFLMVLLQNADAKPTSQAMAGVDTLSRRVEEMKIKWKAFNL
ncbi:MAG: glycoside hydrolase [Cyclobacteriaceae bacterium]|nr:glycoside hydrolase [Cyclobacteriaceae bacterium]